MGTIKKIIVGLDLSKFDTNVLTYLKQVNMIARPEKVTFLNVYEEFNLSTDLLKQFPDLKTTLSKEQVKKLVDECGQYNIIGTDVEYVAHEGNPLEEIMKVAKSKNADLILVGKKNTKEKGVSHVKLARASFCDVLMVTEKANADIKKVLVATDFSDYSKQALHKAIGLASHSSASIILLHVYHVPSGYSKTGKSFEEFAAIMKRNAEEDAANFLQDIDSSGVKIEPLLVLGDADDDYEHIITSAKASKSDLIVVGAKGRTNLTALLVGSVTEKVINNSDIPVYVAKNKGSEFGVMDAFSN